MAGTWRDLIHDAIVEIGAKSDGDALTADEEAGGLRRLKGMLDQWTQDGLLIPFHRNGIHTFSESKDVYTFGKAGSLSDGADPDVIVAFPVEEIDYLNYRRVGNTNDWPMKRVTLNVLQHNHNENSTWPTLWYFERDHPTARLYFNAPTLSGDSFEMHYTSVMDTSFTASDNIDDLFPPGYREALLLNLAIKLAPSYGVKDGRASGLSRQTIEGAAVALKRIRKRHSQVNNAILDPALVTRKCNQILGRYRGGRW